MAIIRTSTSFFAGQWEVWALVRDEQGGLSKRLLVRTPDLDEAIEFE